MANQESRIQAFAQSSEYKESESLSLDFNYCLNKTYSYVRQNIPVVLFGPPGTGKTFIIDEIKKRLLNDKCSGNFELVQFHKKFSYEDFIEGYAPDSNGQLHRKDGVFKAFCKSLSGESGKIDLFVIDELNRAELSTTLGEMLYLLEDRENRSAKTSHFGESLQIPASVSILATMNTADRNISHIDFAIRRRFRFIPLFPDYKVLKSVLLRKGWTDNLGISLENYCVAVEKINNRISAHPLMGRHMQLGHMMFVPNVSDSIISKEDLLEQLVYILLPQIEAYCGFGNESVLKDILGVNVTNKYLANKILDFSDLQSLVTDISNTKSDGA